MQLGAGCGFEMNPTVSTRFDELLRRDIACAAIVDPNDVVLAPLRIANHIPIQKHRRNTSFIEHPGDHLIYLILPNARLERAKNTPKVCDKSRHTSLCLEHESGRSG